MGKKFKGPRRQQQQQQHHQKNNSWNTSKRRPAIIDPSVIAQHAAMTRSAVIQSLDVSERQNNKRKGIEIGNDLTKSQKKKKKKQKKAVLAGGGNDIDTTTKSTSSILPQETKQPSSMMMSSSSLSTDDTAKLCCFRPKNNEAFEDEIEIVRFGNAKWKRMEQLCHLLTLFRSPNETSPSTVVVLVFVTDTDNAKWMSDLFKPILHPFVSTAFHNKVKRQQLLATLRRIRSKSTSTPPSSNQHHQMRNLVVCPDTSLDYILSICNSETKPTSTTQHPLPTDGNQDIVMSVHYDPPKSSNAFRRRLRIFDAVSKRLLLPSSSSSPFPTNNNHHRPRQIVLDGTFDDDDDNNTSTPLLQNSFYANAFLTASAPTLRKHVDDSHRTILQAVLQTALKLKRSQPGSDRQTCAKAKLNAHLAVLQRTMTTKKEDGSTTTGWCGGNHSSVEMMKKMKSLGMIWDEKKKKGGGGVCSKSEKGREAAMTRWLDGNKGQSFGQFWNGPIRYGASSDLASQSLAALFSQSKQTPKTTTTKPTTNDHPPHTCQPRGIGTAWIPALQHWHPTLHNNNNHNIVFSSQTDHRDFGTLPAAKACGHNEMAMFFLRPFAALEVLNTRICSKTSPAPGCDKHEGCLDFIRLICAVSKKGMTIWDCECFAYVNGRGTNDGKRRKKAPVFKLNKSELLVLSKPKLDWVMNAMRQWTLFRESNGCGCDPNQLFRGIDLALRMACRAAASSSNDKMTNVEGGVGKTTWNQLPSKVMCYLMQFVLPGSESDWVDLKTIRIEA